jgi:hypothetical protein
VVASSLTDATVTRAWSARPWPRCSRSGGQANEPPSIVDEISSHVDTGRGEPDLADVVGGSRGRFALELAAAGGHTISRCSARPVPARPGPTGRAGRPRLPADAVFISESIRLGPAVRFVRILHGPVSFESLKFGISI